MPRFYFNFNTLYFGLIKVLILIFLILTLPFNLFAIQAFVLKDSHIKPNLAIIFGASSYTKYPTPILQNRLQAGIDLYQNQDVKYVLVTGDNRDKYYNETRVMSDFLISQNIPSEKIYRDFAGIRTLDSCYRAKAIFQVHSATLVTQSFHLPRANFLCSSFGMQTNLLRAADSTQEAKVAGIMREIPASWLAVYQVFTGKQAELGADGSERIIPNN